MADGDGKTGGNPEGGSSQDQTVQVGDKSYTMDEVQQIISQRDVVTQAAQEIKVLKDLAATYDLSPEELANQAQGAFAIVTNLVDKKVIDPQTYELVEKKEEHHQQQQQTPSFQQRSSSSGDDKFSEVMQQIETLSQTVGQLTREKDILMQARLEDRITGKYPNLTGKEAAQLIAHAAEKRGTDVMEVAKLYSENKDKRAAETKAAMRKSILEEMGLPEDFNPKATEEARKTPAADIVKAKQKKLSWRTGEGHVSPRSVTNEIVNRRFA